METLKFFKVFYGVVVILTLAAEFSKAQCPTTKLEVQQIVHQSMGRCFNTSGQATFDQNKNFVDGTVRLCNDRWNVLECMKQISMYDSCLDDKPGLRQFFHKLFKHSHYEQAINYVCDNVHVLVNNVYCVQAATTDPAAQQCVQGETQIYTEELMGKMKDGEIDVNDPEAMLPMMCKYTEKVIDCMMPPYEACGDDVADVIYRAVTMSFPDICFAKTMKSGSSSNTWKTMAIPTSVSLLVVTVASFFLY